MSLTSDQGAANREQQPRREDGGWEGGVPEEGEVGGGEEEGKLFAFVFVRMPEKMIGTNDDIGEGEEAEEGEDGRNESGGEEGGVEEGRVCGTEEGSRWKIRAIRSGEG